MDLCAYLKKGPRCPCSEVAYLIGNRCAHLSYTDDTLYQIDQLVCTDMPYVHVIAICSIAKPLGAHTERERDMRGVRKVPLSLPQFFASFGPLAALYGHPMAN